MEIDRFVDINLIKENDLVLLEFVVRHSIPTSLQWIIAMDELKKQLSILKESGTKFGFLFDIQKIGLISLNHMKEVTDIMSDNGPLLESNLYASCAIAQGTIIKYMFDALNRFYKTKKPLNILGNREQAINYINKYVY